MKLTIKRRAIKKKSHINPRAATVATEPNNVRQFKRESKTTAAGPVVLTYDCCAIRLPEPQFNRIVAAAIGYYQELNADLSNRCADNGFSSPDSNSTAAYLSDLADALKLLEPVWDLGAEIEAT